MAKVTSPLMSLDASGTVADALVFSKWKGRNYVRQHVIPSNPQSTAQQAVREALGAGGRFNSLVEKGSPADLAEIAAAPSGQSGPSNFVKLQIQNYANSKSDYNNATYATEKGYFDSEATTLGLLDVTIPGATPTTVPAGLILWNAYQAMFGIDPTLASTPSRTATATTISTFAASFAV